MIQPDWLQPGWEEEDWAYWDHGDDQIRVPESAWGRIEAIVRRADGDIELLRALRGHFERLIEGITQSRDPIESVHDMIFNTEPARWRRIEDLSQALKLELEGDSDNKYFDAADEDDEREKTETFLSLLSALAQRAAKLKKSPIKRGRPIQLTRQTAFRQLLGFWTNDLGLALGTGPTSHAGNFLQASAELVSWMKPGDFTPAVAREFLRNVVEEQRAIRRLREGGK